MQVNAISKHIDVQNYACGRGLDAWSSRTRVWRLCAELRAEKFIVFLLQCSFRVGVRCGLCAGVHKVMV